MSQDYLIQLWREHFGEYDNREIWQWAVEEGELPSSYAVSGRLDIATCPMIKGPLEALRRRTVRHVISMAGVQCLKTLLGELWLLWTIARNPGPTQWLQNTNEEAKEHAQERFLDLIHSFPAVAKFYTDNRHDRTSTFIKFRHMFLRLEGAETKSNLQRKSIQHQMRSECWQARYWPPGTLKEADSRLTQFVHNSKKYTESQPGDDAELGTDDMHATFLEGDQNLWQFPCQACGKFQPFLWSYVRQDGSRAAMRWDDTERTRRPSGDWRWAELAPTVRYECIHCGHRHYDDPLTRRRITAEAKFVPQNPDADPSIRSFTWNQLAMPNLSWFKTERGGIYNFLMAHAASKRGYDKLLKEFFQKIIAEPYNPSRHGAFHKIETIELKTDQKDERPIVEQGIKFVHRLMGVDVQADHFWLLIEIWSAAGDALVLHAEKVFTWEDLVARQKQFFVPDENVVIDCAHRTHEVIVEATRRGHWAHDVRGRKVWACWSALRGSDQEQFHWRPKTGQRKGQSIPLPYTWPPAVGDPCAGLPARDPRRLEFMGKFCALYTWSNPTIKDVVIRRRDGRAESVKTLIARGDWNEELSRQMHSQKKVFVRGAYGSGKWKWEAFRDDHLFDCRCMITVRAFLMHLLGSGTAGPNPEAEPEEKSEPSSG